ncbi:MAG TPA: guanine deaminase [bacterium]|nr:guanine deaminase [bacterium]
MELYRAIIINPVNRHKTELFANGALLVGDDGRIIACGDHAAVAARPEAAAARVHDWRGRYLAPGFIDAHAHIPQLDQRARYGETLLDWLQKYIYPAEARFAEPAVARAISTRFFREALKNGTTTVVGYSSADAGATDIAFQVADELGIRACLGQTMMDVNHDRARTGDTDRVLRESIALCERWHGRDRGRLRYVFTPRFAPVCSPALMRGIGDYARAQRIPIQTHLAENEQEMVAVMRLFPECETYTDVYRTYGLLTEQTWLAHCIHLFPSELAMLHDAGCRVIHCPSSNFFLKSGSIRLREMEKQRLPVALGTDIGAGPSFSLCDVMKAMNYAQEYHLPPTAAYYFATLGGAEALGLGDCTGSFSAGKDADFIVIDLAHLSPTFKLEGLEDLLAFLIYLGNDSMVDRVYIRNHPVWERTAPEAIP